MPGETYRLQELLETIEAVTGLDIAVYPPCSQEVSPALERLPTKYHRHHSPFCLAVRQTRDGRGCQGHDSVLTNRRAAKIGRPFVQICPAGAAEAIVPVFSEGKHLASIFIGQVVVEAVERAGFEEIWEKIAKRGCDRAAVKAGFEKLPRLSEARLLQIGRLVDAAVQGLADRLSADAFALEMRLQNAPAVRHALEILRSDENRKLPEAELARRVHLNPAYFCRLFRKVMGRSYKSYIDELRLLLAQNLLQQTDLSIGEIAARCGFSRQSYFTRRFREALGQSPSEYRAQHA